MKYFVIFTAYLFHSRFCKYYMKSLIATVFNNKEKTCCSPKAFVYNPAAAHYGLRDFFAFQPNPIWPYRNLHASKYIQKSLLIGFSIQKASCITHFSRQNSVEKSLILLTTGDEVTKAMGVKGATIRR